MGALSAKPLFWCSPSCAAEAEAQRRASARASAGGGAGAGAGGAAGDGEGGQGGDGADGLAPAEEQDPRLKAREWLKCQHALGDCTCDLHEELLKADEEWLIDLHCEEMMNDEDLCLSMDYFNYLMRSVENRFPKVEPPEPRLPFAAKLRECYAAHAGEEVDRRGRGGVLACREAAHVYQQFVCTDFSRRLARQRKAQKRSQGGGSPCGAPMPARFDGGYD